MLLQLFLRRSGEERSERKRKATAEGSGCHGNRTCREKKRGGEFEGLIKPLQRVPIRYICREADCVCNEWRDRWG